MYMQDVLQTLNRFWSARGCMLWQPYHTEVGAGTSNPATFLRVLGPEPWWVAYPEPSIRPTDGRYAENPNRLQHYYQYQVILKPSPPDVQELFLQSLEALGLDLTKHDFRFVEDNWQSPSLGAWGLGWEAWLDGMEILQFTYFQECGGVKLDVRACELTYGVERIAMYLQGVESVFELTWAPSGITYGDIYRASEIEYCRYNFEVADTEKLLRMFDMNEAEGQRLLDADLVLPAYDHCLRLSHLFNLLDARGALSVSERGRFLLRCRSVAERCAKAFCAQREAMGYPLLRLSYVEKASAADAIPAMPAGLNARDTLVLEIGTEELPHGDIQFALSQAPALVEKLLDEHRLEHGAVAVWISPRRIVIRVDDTPARQEDIVKEVRGPSRAAAQDEQGQWKVAAVKFAEASGVSTSDLYFQKQGKTEYCYAKVRQVGKGLDELLCEIVDKFLKSLQFNKSMGWEDGTATFSRPVRWLLVLHGENVLPVRWTYREASERVPAGELRADRISYGHRRLAPGPISVAAAGAYLDAMRKHYVIVAQDERMACLREKTAALANAHGLEPDQDNDLFDEICDLVEWPEPILCAIPEDALALPEPILITPMKVHQRYIPLRFPNGALSRRFIAVANGPYDAEGQALIRAGNERVLHARLRDAKYFWDTDTRTPLREFSKRLSNVLFHQKLGSVADKVLRLHRLYAELAPVLPPTEPNKMEQVLALMKADLTTQMVFEFESLEGTVGMLYARREGLPEDVALALYEHRLPRRAGDALPASPLGIAAGILDRADSLAGYFGIGIRAKGASDPFGLRRTALGFLSLVETAGLDVNLADVMRAALETYGSVIADRQTALRDLLSFFSDRLAVLMREEGYRYDRVAAVLAAHSTRPVQVRRCLAALNTLDEATVQDLAEQTKRMQRIIKEPAAVVNPALLVPKEQALYNLTTAPCARLARLCDKGDFAEALREVVTWTPIINVYFEDVLVNDDNVSVRQNRHALLRDVFAGLRRLADFTQIEKREAGA